MTTTGADAIIRAATEADVPEVLRITLAAFEDYRGEVADYGALHEAETDVADWLVRGAVLVAERAGVAIGAVRVAPWEEGDWYIGRLAVVPGTPGSVGSRLMGEAERLARAAGAKGVRLGVITSRPKLLRYYERRGYAVVATLKVDDRPGHPGYHWCRKEIDAGG